MPNALHVRQPRPNWMQRYRIAERGGGAELVILRSRISALEKLRRANTSSRRYLLEQGIRIAIVGGVTAEGPPLENRAQTLAVSDASALRLFVQLVEQPQLRGVVRAVGDVVYFVEREGHLTAVSVGVSDSTTLQSGTAAQCLLRVKILSAIVYPRISRSCARPAWPRAHSERVRRRGAHIGEQRNSVRAENRDPRHEGLCGSCLDPTLRRTPIPPSSHRVRRTSSRRSGRRFERRRRP